MIRTAAIQVIAAAKQRLSRSFGPPRFGFWLCLAIVMPQASLAQDAAALRARHASLQAALASNPYGRPIYIESVHNEGDLRGEVYAVVQHPFASAAPALRGMEHWCDILMLHLDVKMCRWSTSGPPLLTVATTRKYDQPLDSAASVDFGYRVVASTPDYQQVQLRAESGPMGTSNYLIVLELLPLDAKSSFLHLSYGYSQGLGGRVAMEAYLATLGRSKVGFTVVDHKPDGSPVYIGNVRGLVERNCMRYFLAIDAYLTASTLPPGEQLERRLSEWHAGAERYPIQLREMSRDDYLAMKRKEIQHQQATAKGTAKPPPTSPDKY
ncbi:MAG TPA: hypothetical protein VIO33_12255 [Burkholderiaceae bacterium]